MDRGLFEAATSGNFAGLSQLVGQNPDILLRKTPLDNTALHIAVMFEHEEFAKKICLSAPSLLLATNSDGETPLHIAAMAGHNSLATFFIQVASNNHPGVDTGRGNIQKQMMMTKNKKGDTALHLALRNSHSSLALELLQAEPEQSKEINTNQESPMYIAAYRGLADAVTELVRLPSSAHGGYYGFNALHAAVIANDRNIVTKLLKERPQLSKAQNNYGVNPLVHAAQANKPEMVRLLLSLDPSAAYDKAVSGTSAFHYAAQVGNVQIAEELIRHCPDSGFLVNNYGRNALHVAVSEEQLEFVAYILRTPVLRGLLNQPDNNWDTPLHLAAQRCNPGILRALLADSRLDRAASKGSMSALDKFFREVEPAKTLKWNEVYTLLSHATPGLYTGELWHTARKKLSQEAIQQIQSLTQRYTQNNTVTATLIATVTFAAAFTMPGGYISDDGPDQGLPILARKAAFRVFLISDAISMCSSLVVAFLCVFAEWEDVDFLLHYRAFTRKLLVWFAFPAMLVAFATAMFTLVAPGSLGLAIVICVLCCALPFLTYVLGGWPLYKLRLRFGRTFRPDLLEQV